MHAATYFKNFYDTLCNLVLPSKKTDLHILSQHKFRRIRQLAYLIIKH